MCKEQGDFRELSLSMRFYVILHKLQPSLPYSTFVTDVTKYYHQVRAQSME